jgi:UDP-glucose 4-epimerase
MFKNKSLLITGGTGSFGNAVVNSSLSKNFKEIVIFSRDEKKQEEMRLQLNNKKLKFIIGDVRDHKKLEQSMIGIDYVFHAAALKQVPSCEFYPLEALKTNILGTENVIDSAIKNKITKLVLLSTDKAVYPINAMGMSKAMAEKVLVAKSRQIKSKTVICATRYGNVMASRGSAIPLFISQIIENKPITLTDPNMTRFLMSLDESVKLVFYAFSKGQQGDIFIQKSPSSTIIDLAKALQIIFKRKNNIKIIGTRHGEKAHETLVNREEMIRAVSTNKYFRIPADNRSLNFKKYFVSGDKKITNVNDYTSANTKRLSVNEVIDKLKKLEFVKNSLKNA